MMPNKVCNVEIGDKSKGTILSLMDAMIMSCYTCHAILCMLRRKVCRRAVKIYVYLQCIAF